MREITEPAGAGKDGPAYLLHSVDHALQLLLLVRSRPSLRVSEVADHLSVARSTAHRLLGMLVHREFAEQDPATKTYRPGPRLVEIGLAAVGALDLRARLRPFLLDVASATAETVSVLVLEHDTVHFIDSIESLIGNQTQCGTAARDDASKVHDVSLDVSHSAGSGGTHHRMRREPARRSGGEQFPAGGNRQPGGRTRVGRAGRARVAARPAGYSPG